MHTAGDWALQTSALEMIISTNFMRSFGLQNFVWIVSQVNEGSAAGGGAVHL